MQEQNFEITISKSGEVKVHIKGVKGKACLNYVKWLEQVVGKVKSQNLTSEYYEPEAQTRIEARQHIKEKE
jgi:hypothetical protein